MGNIKIAHVSNMIGGGMGTVFRVLLPAQVARGDAVTFFVRHLLDEDRSYFDGKEVETERIGGIIGLVRKLRSYDVVHFHSADLDLLVAGWLCRVPTIFTLHGLRAQTRSLRSIRLGRLPTLRGVRRRWKRLVLSLLLRHAMSRVTGVSEFLAERLRTQYGVKRGKVDVVYNGIVSEQFRYSSRLQNESDWVIGWVGRLVDVKRVDVFLRVVADIVRGGEGGRLRAIVVGDGPLRDELASLAELLGVDNAVEFLGYSDEPWKYLGQMDLFVFPSRNEGAPMALCEAMAAGVPAVVLEDGGGAAELVARSGGGVVVSDEKAMAQVIRSLLANPQRRRELTQKALDYASREFRPVEWAGKYEVVYSAAIAGSRTALGPTT